MPEFSNLCRICLKENSAVEEMQPLFEESDRCIEIVQQIEECGGIVLKPHEDFPKLICQQCLDYLDTSYKFRAMCQASEHALLDVIIKTELQIQSVDGNSQPATDAEYIEIRGEFIEAEEIDLVEADQVDGGSVEIEEYCERYSPMPTENEEEVEEDDEEFVAEYMEDEHMEDDDPEFQFETIKKAKTRRKTVGSMKKSTNKASLVGGIKRKRGRPRLSGLSFADKVKLERQDYDDQEVKVKSTRGRKKAEDMPSSIMCEICGNIYSKPALLHVHMRRHMVEKPFECE